MPDHVSPTNAQPHYMSACRVVIIISFNNFYDCINDRHSSPPTAQQNHTSWQLRFDVCASVRFGAYTYMRSPVRWRRRQQRLVQRSRSRVCWCVDAGPAYFVAIGTAQIIRYTVTAVYGIYIRVWSLNKVSPTMSGRVRASYTHALTAQQCTQL